MLRGNHREKAPAGAQAKPSKGIPRAVFHGRMWSAAEAAAATAQKTAESDGCMDDVISGSNGHKVENSLYQSRAPAHAA